MTFRLVALDEHDRPLVAGRLAKSTARPQEEATMPTATAPKPITRVDVEAAIDRALAPLQKALQQPAPRPTQLQAAVAGVAGLEKALEPVENPAERARQRDQVGRELAHTAMLKALGAPVSDHYGMGARRPDPLGHEDLSQHRATDVNDRTQRIAEQHRRAYPAGGQLASGTDLEKALDAGDAAAVERELERYSPMVARDMLSRAAASVTYRRQLAAVGGAR